MAEPLSPEEVRRILSFTISDQDATAMAAWYANLSRAVALFPAGDLKDVEPPLRSVAGPAAR
jgi:hypothetical protein